MRANVDELAGIAAIVQEVGAASWEVFFLVQVGRGRDEQELSPPENEDVAHLLFEASHYGFAVRTVEGPWCRRVAAWEKGRPRQPRPPTLSASVPFTVGSPLSYAKFLGLLAGAAQMASAGTRDGKGIFFVAHDGWVYPAGFLPLRLGNVREQGPSAPTGTIPFFGRSGRPSSVGGAAAVSSRTSAAVRGRAFASSGDPLAEDRACAYVPA